MECYQLVSWWTRNLSHLSSLTSGSTNIFFSFLVSGWLFPSFLLNVEVYLNSWTWWKTIPCVPIKRKPGLSVRYLHCHAIFNETIMLHYQGHFLFFHLIPNTWWYLNAWLKRNNLNSCMSKSICAEYHCWVDMTKFRLANPCQNKESSTRNMTKETKEMLMNVFSTHPFILKRGRPH